MSRVNPPPHLRIPRKLYDDPEMRDYFQQFEFIMFQLWKRVGGSNDAVADAAQYNTKTQAAFGDLINRIGSGDALTSDDTGFTADLDMLTVDMVEA